MTRQRPTKGARGEDRAPILVTGVPRSGTTWLARVLAAAPGTALAGREPMNPRGSQYGLGGTLHAWSRLESLTPGQRRRLRAAYRGYNPWVYSRYGQRQWAAPFPRTTMVVKDPFAMLSLPAVVGATGAIPVLLYRHPAAVLASYRRMGWTADVAEVAAAVPDLMAGNSRNEADALQMARFWAALNNQALRDLASIPGGVVVGHEDLASGGTAASRRLFEALDLGWDGAVERRLSVSRATEGDSRPIRQLCTISTGCRKQWRALGGRRSLTPIWL